MPLKGFAGLANRFAWAPVWVLAAAICLLYLFGVDFLVRPFILIPILNFVFITCVCLFISWKAARSYLASGSISLLLFGCGALFFGITSVAGGVMLASSSLNAGVTICNVGVLLAGLCHLASVVLAITLPQPVRRQCHQLPLLLSYLGVAGITAALTAAAVGNSLPLFFIQGEGPNLVRQIVLGRSIGVYSLCALLLALFYRRQRIAFIRWYSIGTALIAVGLVSFFIIDHVGSLIGRIGHFCQYLGTAYWLIAVLLAGHQRGEGLISLEQVLHEAEEALRKSEARYRLLSETTSRLLRSDNPQEIVQELCTAVVEHLECDCFFNFLTDETGIRLQLNAYGGVSEEVAGRIQWLDYGVAVCGWAAREGKSLVIEDIQHTRDSRTVQVKELGMQAFACHPLISGGRVIGTLSFGTRRRTAFASDELELMKNVADHVAVAMQRIGAMRALRERDQRLSIATDAGRLGIFEWDMAGGHVRWENQQMYDIYGHHPEDGTVTTRDFFERYVHPDDAKVFKQALHAGPLPDRVFHTTFRIHRKNDGSLRWLDMSGQFDFDAEGRPRRLTGILSDVTDRKQTETRIQRQNALLQGINHIFESALLACSEEELGMICLSEAEKITDSRYGFIGVIGEEGQLHDIAMSETGWEACRMVDKTGHRREPGTLPINGIYGRVIRDGKGFFTNQPQSHPDRAGLPEGHLSIEAFLGAPLISNGKVIGLIAVANREGGYHEEHLKMLEAMAPAMVEAFLRLRAEQSLRQSREDLNHAQAVCRAGNWRLDVQNDVLIWSDENYRIFEIEKGASLTYETFLAAVHPEDRKYVREKWVAALRGEPYDVEHRILVKGKVKWVREKAGLEFDGKGNLRGGFGITQDITELKNAELLLVQARDELESRVRQRTEELERTIETLGGEVEQRIAAEKKLREVNAELEKRAEQLSRLTTELTLAEQRERQRLAHVLHDHLQQLLVAAKLEINLVCRQADEEQQQGLRGAMDLIAESIQESRNLTVELAPPILHEAGLVAGLEWLGRWKEEKYGLKVNLRLDPKADIVRDELSILLFQSVRELLFNTIKHAGVGEVFVELGKDGSDIEVCVRDEGRGFDIEEMWSKAAQSDGGFGLFSIRERLLLAGGRMEVLSRPGEGASFRLIIPAEALQPVKAEPRFRIEAVAREDRDYPITDGGERQIRILLVDDHSIMRRGLATMLRQEPLIHIVGEAANGAEGVRKARELTPDVILMDFSMPEMNGVEATEIIRGELEQTRVIGLSMFDEADRAAAMLQAGAFAYASKSESPDVLLSAIRAAYADLRRQPAQKDADSVCSDEK